MSLLRTILGDRTERRLFESSSIIPSAGSAYADSMSEDQATRIIAVFRSAQILADTVSTLPVGTFQRQGDARVPGPRPAWLDVPDPTDPSITRIDHFSQVMWGLVLDGNSFTLALPDVYDVSELHVLDPQKVTIKRGPIYQIRPETGGVLEVGPDQMVHIARSRKGGALRGLSPIEEASLALGTNRFAARFSNRVFRNGSYISGYVTVPGSVSTPDLEQLKDEIVAQYGGDNQMKPGAFANGAEWRVPTLNLEQLQFLETQKWGKTEVADLFGIPPHLLAITDPGAMAYNSVDAVGIDFEQYTISPYIRRIEAAYARLIPGGLDTIIKFNTNGLLRGDFKTRTEGYAQLLQNKVVTRDEVRAWEDLAPAESDEGGFLQTPNNNAPMPGRQIA